MEDDCLENGILTEQIEVKKDSGKQYIISLMDLSEWMAK